MEDQVRQATQAEAKAMTALKGAEREVQKIEDKLSRLQKGAELAVGQDDEDTAREAVNAQISLEEKLKNKQEALTRATKAKDDAKAARQQVQGQLDELRSKKDDILTRARVASNRKKTQRSVHGHVNSSQSILDSVEQLESRVDETEAELEVQQEMSGHVGKQSLEKKLDDLEKKGAVEERLAALKKKAGSGSNQ
jgi:phage shock protein A